jgi:biopolymer transport protein ExbD
MPRLFPDLPLEAAPRKKPIGDGDLDITPMIDCVFLLLIFFMVASNMTSSQNSALPVARHGVGVETSNALIFTLAPADPSGKRALITDEAGQQLDLEAVSARVEAHLARGLRQVIVLAQRGLAHGAVREAARAVGTHEGVQFYVGVQDK